MGEHDDIAARCARIAGAAAGHDDLDAAVADLHRLPPGLPERGRLAAALVEAILRVDVMTDLSRTRYVGGLLEIADGAGFTSPGWPRARVVAEASSLLYAVAQRERRDFDVVSARLEELAAQCGDDPGVTTFFEWARAGVRAARSLGDADPGGLAGLPVDIERLLATFPHDESRLGPLHELMTAFGEFAAANSRAEDITDLVHRIQALAGELPPGEPRTAVEEAFATMSVLLASGSTGGAPALAEEWLRRQAQQSDLPADEEAIRRSAAAMAAMGMGEEKDVGRVSAGVDGLREALRLAGTGPQRVFHLFGLAVGLVRRSELTNSSADLREAAALLQEARTHAGGPHHPQWQAVNEMLADVRRLVGDEPAFHKSAVEGLRAAVWRVLVQEDRAGVAAAVRGVSASAVEVARRCLVAQDPSSAVAALDAGRGLALFAATEANAIGERLVAAGESELAERWAAAAGHDSWAAPGSLRREVMMALAARGSTAALLDAPPVETIQEALRATDADALVYLVPSARPVPGYAVIVPATGPPSYMALPALIVEDVDLGTHVDTLSRNADPARVLGPASASEMGCSVDALCSWAWGAAVGPLVESYLTRLSPHPSGRPHHVVLVPMGGLARVPWQAARRDDGTYAVELVAISQAASARMLCRSAALPPVAPSSTGLVVGDPRAKHPETNEPVRDLFAARLEAFAIQQAFYRGARYVGRRPNGSVSPSGTGSVAEVTAWLGEGGGQGADSAEDEARRRRRQHAAGSWLHLACHGYVGPSEEATAYLLLADDVLRAEELVALMARAPERRIGLVVLAACCTAQSLSSYDEAYSLGTTFLAGGARSVLSTLWEVPDTSTSALMFMFHHFVRVERLAPWAALRRAQLWMLDPKRQLPAEMPAQLLAHLRTDELDRVVAWAGFVHSGQ